MTVRFAALADAAAVPVILDAQIPAADFRSAETVRMTRDVVLAVAAADRVGLPLSDRWPTVAAYLLAAGLDGEKLVELASLLAHPSGWEVDQLAPAALVEIGCPELNADEVGEVLARLIALRTAPGSGHPLIRALASFAAVLDYPGGVIGRAYNLEEYLDCDCHMESRVAADAFERELRALPPLAVPPQLASALTD